MASNDFSKEERVAFDDVIEGFQDALVASKNVNVYGTDGQLMERARDTIWRPQQYISVGRTVLSARLFPPRARSSFRFPQRSASSPTTRSNWTPLSFATSSATASSARLRPATSHRASTATCSPLPAFRGHWWSRPRPLRASTITSRCATASATSRASQPTTAS